jgi:hypothetical protein
MELNLKIIISVPNEEDSVVNINLIENVPVCFFAHESVLWYFILKDNGLIKITIAQKNACLPGQTNVLFALNTVELSPEKLSVHNVEILSETKEGFVKISPEVFFKEVNDWFKTYILQ